MVDGLVNSAKEELIVVQNEQLKLNSVYIFKVFNEI